MHLYYICSMNSHITSFFVINKDNITVAHESNLSNLIKVFSNIEPNARQYMYYYRLFKKDPQFTQTIDGKEYHFQRLV